jgi:hypothetical protein
MSLSFSLISDKILTDMGSIIKVEQESGKEYLRLNKENNNSGSQQNKSELSGSVSASVGPFGGSVSAKTVEEKSDEWKKDEKSLNEQVKYFCNKNVLLFHNPPSK